VIRATALLIALLAIGTANSYARSTTRPCGPRDAPTLAASHVARVYSQQGFVYGCSTHSGGRYKLGSSARSIREARIEPVALAGVVAAYGQTTFGVDTISAVLVVRRLSDGRKLTENPAFDGVLGAEFTESVQAVVVLRDGSAAWIVQGGSIISAQRTTEVVALSQGHERLLDSNVAGLIDPRSLRLHGSKLTWTHGGATRSATLR
jgi:hypothetical protein